MSPIEKSLYERLRTIDFDIRMGCLHWASPIPSGIGRVEVEMPGVEPGSVKAIIQVFCKE